MNFNKFCVTASLSLGLLAGCEAGIEGQEIGVGDGATLTCQGAPYPIILAHGMGGFDRFGPIEYFFGVEDDLQSRGNEVFTSQVPPYQSSLVRAQVLAGFVDEVLANTGACKVNIIAHSQGGLDARALIGSLGYGDVVSSVVTVSTPHKGSAIADLVLDAPDFTDPLLNAVAVVLGVAVNDLGTDADIIASLNTISVAGAADFAADNPDDPRVAFFSVAGRSLGRRANSDCVGAGWTNSSRIDVMDPLLTPTGLILQGINPFNLIPNDGLVTVASAKHGTFLGCIPADHFDEVGQVADIFVDPISKFDHKKFYRDLVSFLRARGH
jgi:triacylglycerol lipase